MNDARNEQDRTQVARQEEEQVRRLLERAGARPQVPEEDLALIKAAFRREWEMQVAKRPRSAGWKVVLPLAAVLALVVGLGVWWASWVPEAVGDLVRVDGALTLGGARGEEAPSPGRELAAGVELATGEEARAALRLAGGAEVRIDSGSRLRLVSARAVELIQGAIYLDSGEGESGPSGLEVHTALGVVRDLGTRFEVRLLGGGGLQVRVRDGEVRLTRGETQASATAGMELTLLGDGSLERHETDPYGPSWQWALLAAEPLDIEGRPLADLLAWVARETGWQVRFEDPALEASAAAIILHGGIGDLPPDQALALVLPGAGLRHELEGRTLTLLRQD